MDYFMEIGLKPEIFKDKDLYKHGSDKQAELLKPTIITKFPNFDRRNIVIEESMIQQIFPKNFEIKESEKRPNPEFYCIVLDNQLYSAIYTNKYLACLIIYESLESYKTLYNKYNEKKTKRNSLRKFT